MIRFLAGLWSGIEGKLLIGAAGALLVLAVCFWGLWRMADDARARTAAELLDTKDALAEQVEENARAQLAIDALARRADQRAERRETQARDEEAIRNEPVTYDCAASPAVRGALGILRERGAGDTPLSDRP